MISGPVSTSPDLASTVTTTTTTPSSARTRRSRSTPLAHIADDAVDVEVAGRDLADEVDPAVGQLDDVAVLGEQHPGGVDAHLLGQPGVMGEVPELAVHGNEAVRAGQRQ